MEFLSDEWFAKVEELKQAAGDLNCPDAIKEVVVNVNVTKGDGSTKMHMKAGEFFPDHDDSAPATLTVSADLARKIFVDNDLQAGMQAFMAGEIKVEGDMSKVMALTTTPPSDEQKKLLQDIAAMTS